MTFLCQPFWGPEDYVRGHVMCQHLWQVLSPVGGPCPRHPCLIPPEVGGTGGMVFKIQILNLRPTGCLGFYSLMPC